MANRIRQFREANGLTQSDLAKTVGVARQTVLAIEKGRYDPSLSLAFKIAAAFDVTIEEIFDPPGA